MSYDVDRNRRIVRRKFDEYLEEVSGYLDRELVQTQPFWKRWKAEDELDALVRNMHEQRHAVLGYAQDIAEGEDPVSENLHEYDHMQNFLQSNPLRKRVPNRSPLYDDLVSDLAQHFVDVSHEVSELLVQDGETFGELLSQAYDREEAERVIEDNVAQTDRFKSYASAVDMGIGGLFVNFERDIFPVISDAEDYVMEQVAQDLDQIYGIQ